jgi:cell division protein FtsQ
VPPGDRTEVPAEETAASTGQQTADVVGAQAPAPDPAPDPAHHPAAQVPGETPTIGPNADPAGRRTAETTVGGNGRARWAPRTRRRALAAVAIAAAVAVAAAVGLTHTSLFAARTLRVRGAEHLTRAQVLRIAGLSRGVNVFHFGAAAAEGRLEAEPWVATAVISKDLPSTVVVRILEHAPVGIVDEEGVQRLVAEDGSLLDAAVRSSLPQIVVAPEGATAPDAVGIRAGARALAAMTPSLRRDVGAVTVLPEGELRLDLRSGVEVIYGPALDLVRKAQALGALLRWVEAQGSAVASIDVRVPSSPTAQLVGG